MKCAQFEKEIIKIYKNNNNMKKVTQLKYKLMLIIFIK